MKVISGYMLQLALLLSVIGGCIQTREHKEQRRIWAQIYAKDSVIAFQTGKDLYRQHWIRCQHGTNYGESWHIMNEASLQVLGMLSTNGAIQAADFVDGGAQ